MLITPSILSYDRTPYACQHSWPDGCRLQCGDQGIVFTATGSYSTAYFEAFPPDTFIRGEGTTIADAEQDAFAQYQRQLQCSAHMYERGTYRNGYGICKYCGRGALVFTPLEHCSVCQEPTYFLQAPDGRWYCAAHEDQVPLEELSPAQQLLRRVGATDPAVWEAPLPLEQVLAALLAGGQEAPSPSPLAGPESPCAHAESEIEP